MKINRKRLCHLNAKILFLLKEILWFVFEVLARLRKLGVVESCLTKANLFLADCYCTTKIQNAIAMPKSIHIFAPCNILLMTHA